MPELRIYEAGRAPERVLGHLREWFVLTEAEAEGVLEGEPLKIGHRSLSLADRGRLRELGVGFEVVRHFGEPRTWYERLLVP